MVWGKLFGGGRKDKPVDPDAGKSPVHLLLETLDPAWREAFKMVVSDPQLDAVYRDILYRNLTLGQIEEARTTLRQAIPMMTKANRDRIQHLGQAQAWASDDDLLRAGIFSPKGTAFPVDYLELGYMPRQRSNGEAVKLPVMFHGEGHLLTVAPTGSGKGQRFILRTLLEFEGPVVVLDPKGENYRETAWRRDLYGQVYKWAPGEDDSDCYNPLDRVKGWDDARLLAELLVVPQSKEPFWDDAARDLLTGLIFYVMHRRPRERRNMREVCRLLAASKADFDAMVEDLQGSDDERLQELGNIIETQSEALRTSITTTLRTQLAVWRSDDVAAVTSSSTPGWSVETILRRDNSWITQAAREGRAPGWYYDEEAGEVHGGRAASIYLIVSPEKMSSMRTVLRVMLGQHLSEAIRVRRMLDEENATDAELPKSYPNWPMTFYFDEMPQLGYMRIIEDAVAITRSYRIRLWLFTQDIAQLKEVYQKWESLIANCRCQVYFRPNDQSTAEHVANRLGKRKDLWGGEDWVASPQQLMGPEFREDCVIIQDGLTIRARMSKPSYADEDLKEWIIEQKGKFGEEIHRAPRSERVPVIDPDQEPEAGEPPPDASEPSTPEDADLKEDAEYQEELAALQARMRARRSGPPPKATKDDDEGGGKRPDSPSGASEPPRRPPTPPSFNE
ncbi:type IV secretory system conjugative DNA transfer family protein [Polymorphum gilvum]|uniref:Plasmid transfer factor, traG n=1 Tax=Polymorphum gilvum (strain LMG 25793 / CGMCC 1.9160 / SL003B-26A1) TaxID=991905 RepID=F2J3U0_POLGS|nr:type IV secretory system conjugative DNA transfer family protein [Polymorphum gilvum]ADZ68922.1 Plasmid transfer factor, traG [Polymorphum gilvum SL003B-26A1]